MRPVHPGEILSEEYLAPLELSANALAQAIGVPTHRVTSILRGRRSVTAETALLLAKAFNTTPQFWLNLQSAHDLSIATSESASRLKAVRRLCG